MGTQQIQQSPLFSFLDPRRLLRSTPFPLPTSLLSTQLRALRTLLPRFHLTPTAPQPVLAPPRSSVDAPNNPSRPYSPPLPCCPLGSVLYLSPGRKKKTPYLLFLAWRSAGEIQSGIGNAGKESGEIYGEFCAALGRVTSRRLLPTRICLEPAKRSTELGCLAVRGQKALGLSAETA